MRYTSMTFALGLWGAAAGACSESAAADREFDAQVPDASAPAVPDADASSAADAQSWTPPPLRLPGPDSQEEVRLSQLGLYEDIVAKRVARDLLPFEPKYPLWSDGAEKQRWLRLPPGPQIDTSDMDHWQFPIGTVLFKEFARDGKRLETRLLARVGPAPTDYWMGAFVWQEDEADAVLAREGASGARGTDHDVPPQKNCFTCHNGEPGRVLGFSAVQQPSAPAALLSAAPARAFNVPGDAATASALGYLHANCGNCHNPNGSARPDTDMNLRLSVRDLEVAATTVYRSTVGVRLQYFASAPLTVRVAPGDPAQSGVLVRMGQRGPRTQMPPLATKIVDPRGVELVRAWIAGLPAAP